MPGPLEDNLSAAAVAGALAGAFAESERQLPTEVLSDNDEIPIIQPAKTLGSPQSSEFYERQAT